jgi:uncharacterized protein YigE (DUF2233 family)
MTLKDNTLTLGLIGITLVDALGSISSRILENIRLYWRTDSNEIIGKFDKLSNNVLFAISKQPINFYDFAKHFQLIECKQALYLDDVISKMYEAKFQSIPEHTPFGVIIAISKSATPK